MPGFDLARLDTLTLAETGQPMPIVNPRTAQAMLNDDGSQVTITLHGRQSEAFRDALKRIQEKRAEMIGEKKEIDQVHREREDTATLIACTVNWTIQTLDGVAFPCSPENIRKLWSDPRFRNLREQAMGFILGDVNFLPPGPANSDDMLGISSPSTGHSPPAAPASGKPSPATG